MLHRATVCRGAYLVAPFCYPPAQMPLEIDGTRYYSATEVIEALRVTRQTFWRWRREGKVPLGHRFRDGHVVFTETEMERAREYANRIEPISLSSPDQLKLFNGAT